MWVSPGTKWLSCCCCGWKIWWDAWNYKYTAETKWGNQWQKNNFVFRLVNSWGRWRHHGLWLQKESRGENSVAFEHTRSLLLVSTAFVCFRGFVSSDYFVCVGWMQVGFTSSGCRHRTLRVSSCTGPYTLAYRASSLQSWIWKESTRGQ